MCKLATDRTLSLYLNQQVSVFPGASEAGMGSRCSVLKQPLDQAFSADLHLL